MDIRNFLKDYISCASVSSDVALLPEMAKARQHLLRFFSNLSIYAREVPTRNHAAVFAKTEQKPDRPTILVYGHYDVQPADACDLWQTPPFTLIEKHGRFYGRGVSDNKGCHSAILMAVRDIIASGRELPVNLKFLIEGEEEIGSCNMAQLLHEMRSELSADFALVADTWSLNESNIVITTGLRGLVGCEIELVGQARDLHSGYGGCVRNPIQALVNICSRLHTTDGLVAIDHFYDDVAPPSAWERNQVMRLPLSDGDVRDMLHVRELQFPHTGYSAAETMRFFPTLEFNGISGGHQGGGIKTIIPHRASAKITCRLVPNQKAGNIQQLLQETINKLCPVGMDLNMRFEQSANPYLLEVPNNRKLARTISFVDEEIAKTFGRSPTYLRDGGSIGFVSMLKESLDIDSILIGLTTSDDAIHAPNENIKVSMLEKGIKFFRSFFTKF